jgi:hypothetical protein
LGVDAFFAGLGRTGRQRRRVAFLSYCWRSGKSAMEFPGLRTNTQDYSHRDADAKWMSARLNVRRCVTQLTRWSNISTGARTKQVGRSLGMTE